MSTTLGLVATLLAHWGLRIHEHCLKDGHNTFYPN